MGSEFQVFSLPPGVMLRSDLHAGDVQTLVQMHREIYAREYGFDETFAAYVEGPLAQFARSALPRERIWIAERTGRIVGCVAIVEGEGCAAQLRWFLVDPAMRGQGLGKRLLNEALRFAAESGYQSVYLWTVSALTAAAKLYRAAGFRKVDEKPGHWGVDVLEEKYVVDVLRVNQATSASRPRPSQVF